MLTAEEGRQKTRKTTLSLCNLPTEMSKFVISPYRVLMPRDISPVYAPPMLELDYSALAATP